MCGCFGVDASVNVPEPVIMFLELFNVRPLVEGRKAVLNATQDHKLTMLRNFQTIVCVS